MKAKVLVTGASGFLGKEIVKFLSPDYSIISLGKSSHNDISVDLSGTIPDLPEVDHVIHAAGKAHSIPVTKAEEQLFYRVNVEGTSNLLNGLISGNTKPKSILFISSVSVYGLKKGVAISEQSPLLAVDPYGKSKVIAEDNILTFCSERGITCGILRLPLIVGINPPGNLAKMIAAIRKNKWLHISGGRARRSMVLVEDVVRVLEKVMDRGGIYNLTDGQHPSYRELYQLIAKRYQRGQAFNLPYQLAWIMAKLGDLGGRAAPFNTGLLEKLSNDLTFADEKARKELGWQPTPVLDGFPAILTHTSHD